MYYWSLLFIIACLKPLETAQLYNGSKILTLFFLFSKLQRSFPAVGVNLWPPFSDDHDGGKRCMFAGCMKGGEGSTPLCKAHGGGKRCLHNGGEICPKSVRSGTNFCYAHGGGKRCSFVGCTTSAHGLSESCVKHGGGRRCQYPSCAKGVQDSTIFCKAHGGGKRCNWGGEGKCEKFARGKSGMCAAHINMALEREKQDE